MKKIFISYSHEDEKHKNDLDTHLSLLKRNGLVESWHDRKISASELWKDKIDCNLLSSDVIVFLLSANFIASDYCYDIEVKKAIELHKNGTAEIIPIIVRPCDWKDSHLGDIQALPKDARPIETWQNRDEAWLDVIQGIKKVFTSSNTRKVDNLPKNITFTASHELWINDLDVNFSHRNKSRLSLDDIGICPDLKRVGVNLDKLAQIYPATDTCDKSNRYLIFGDEQSGKTTLLKILSKRILSQRKLPVYISSTEINSTKVIEIVRSSIKKQLTGDSPELNPTQNNRYVILIDDFSSCKLNSKAKNEFVSKLNEAFEHIIITANESFQYTLSEIAEFDSYVTTEILKFGNAKRSELIEKWIKLGVENEIHDQDVYAGVDELKIYVNGLVSKNIVPPKPLYLLTMLQMFESISPQNVDLTSSGHCYQFLIYKALEKLKIKKTEVETYFNFLTELAGHILINKKLNEESVSNFINEYNKKYLKINGPLFIENLSRVHIIKSSEDGLEFKYKYLYYYFAAKFLSDSLSKNEANKSRIHDLVLNLHRSDCANVIIFLTHHTKDPWVLSEIQKSISELFSTTKEARLAGPDLAFMQDFLREIPKLILEQRDIVNERRNAEVKADEKDEIEAKIDEKFDASEATDLLAQINRTFKGIELIGHIIRNRHGSLEKETLVQLTSSAYKSGLRFLQFFLNVSESAKEEIIKNIAYMLDENPDAKNAELEKEARKLYILMSYSVVFGVLRRIAHSLGCKNAEELYSSLIQEDQSPAVTLINQCIELQFMKKIDIKKIKNILNSFDQNPLCERMLKEIVVNHLYMHHVEIRDKQKISEALDIPMQFIRQIQGQKRLEA